MNRSGAHLVVGGDSLVGGRLAAELAERGHAVYATTRRAGAAGGTRLPLDLEDAESFTAPPDAGCAYIVAAATSYERCETDPQAWRTNVVAIPALAARLLEQGLFVTFISTNSVFGGERPWPREDDEQDPRIAYARQKSEGEMRIRLAAGEVGADDRLAVVRLTKVLNVDTPPLPTWFTTWKRREVVEPFSDLVFAPMSLSFVARGLAVIGERRVAGPLHLSGAENVTYVELARLLADRLGVDERLVAYTTADEKGVSILFKPRYSGLHMGRTKALTGITPQTLEGMVDDLVAGI